MDFFEEVEVLEREQSTIVGASMPQLAAAAATAVTDPVAELLAMVPVTAPLAPIPECPESAIAGEQAVEPAPEVTPSANGGLGSSVQHGRVMAEHADGAVPDDSPDDVDAPAAAADPVPAQPGGTGDAVPAAAPGHGFTAQWHRLLAIHTEIRQAINRCHCETRDTFGTSITVAESQDLNRIRDEIVSMVVWKASKQFAVLGAALDIPIDQVKKALATKANYHPERDDRHLSYLHPRERQGSRLSRLAIEEQLCQDFDPDAIWHHLEDLYGGAAGEKLALQKIARLLVENLGLKRRPPQEDKGRLLIVTTAYNEKSYMHPHPRVYTDSTRTDLQHARNCLAMFAQWAGHGDTARALEHTKVAAVDDYDKPIVSRERVAFGAIEWTFFCEKVEMRFSAELGLKFRQFVAEFGPRPDADC